MAVHILTVYIMTFQQSGDDQAAATDKYAPRKLSKVSYTLLRCEKQIHRGWRVRGGVR